jgi:hypothetical protein
MWERANAIGNFIFLTYYQLKIDFFKKAKIDQQYTVYNVNVSKQN